MNYSFIIKYIRTSPIFNELFFSLARTSFLESSKKGIIQIISDSPEELYEEINSEDLTTDIYYLINDKLEEFVNKHPKCKSLVDSYDPSKQYILNINSKLAVITRLLEDKIMYKKSSDDIEFDELEYPCFKCQATNKLLIDENVTMKQCVMCNKEVQIKKVYECLQCCTKTALL